MCQLSGGFFKRSSQINTGFAGGWEVAGGRKV